MRKSEHPKARAAPYRVAGWILVLGAVAVISAGGCASSRPITLRSVPKSPLIDRFKLTARSGPEYSQRTMQFLRVYDLTEDLQGDPRVLLEKVQAIIDREPMPEKAYAAAELSFLAARKAEPKEPKLALDLYGASVLSAYQYLFDPRFESARNPYDPQYRGACDLYNGALENALRLVSKDKGLVPGQTYTISTAAGSWDITCELRGGRWRNEDFQRFEFVSDYEMNGLKNHYRAYGLGIPLIAVRRSYQDEPSAAKYYPEGLSFPVTAFLRPLPEAGQVPPGTEVHRRGVLELYDPLSVTHLAIGDQRVSLESDLTTPVAWFLSNPALENVATLGLLRPDKLLKIGADKSESAFGMYMVQPYEPGKIPVLFVHGLWSSPMTWMEMFNDLRSSPQIRDRYQFWFYLYPTGQPFWISAAQLRRDLTEARYVLDPERREPALDQMVLIGHSMGGLVSRLQTIDSGNDYWSIVSDEPFHLVKAEPEVRQRLAKAFFFQPNPSIRRVVTIGTPHRGSSFSNQPTRWMADKLISLPRTVVQSQEKLFRQNKGFFRDASVLKINNSIDSLSPRSPFFPVMLASHHPPWVKYHNIIGQVSEQGWLGSVAAGSDGVVSCESAHLDGVESELVVTADHTSVHSHPLAVLEVRRILLEHLAELRAFPSPGPTQIRTASAPVVQQPVAPPQSHPPGNSAPQTDLRFLSSPNL